MRIRKGTKPAQSRSSYKPMRDTYVGVKGWSKVDTIRVPHSIVLSSDQIWPELRDILNESVTTWLTDNGYIGADEVATLDIDGFKMDGYVDVKWA